MTSPDILLPTYLDNKALASIVNNKYNFTFTLLNSAEDAASIYGEGSSAEINFASSYSINIENAWRNILNGSAANTYSVMWQDVANISFTTTDENGNNTLDPGDEDVGDITIGQSTSPYFQSGSLAAASTYEDDYYPPDIWVNTTNISGKFDQINGLSGNVNVWDYANSGGGFASASYAYYSILHEIGHALGLHHPDANNDGEHDGDESSQNYTIMSYTSATGMGSSDIAYNVTPAGLQLLDIEAIQSIYGRNYDTRSTSTTYDKGGAFADNSKPHDAFIYTIWDGGGTDTIDASD